jgi:hypothetical protein
MVAGSGGPWSFVFCYLLGSFGNKSFPRRGGIRRESSVVFRCSVHFVLRIFFIFFSVGGWRRRTSDSWICCGLAKVVFVECELCFQYLKLGSSGKSTFPEIVSAVPNRLSGSETALVCGQSYVRVRLLVLDVWFSRQGSDPGPSVHYEISLAAQIRRKWFCFSENIATSVVNGCSERYET